MVVCRLSVSCLLSRAAVFPHEKLEQLIACSAAPITHGSCSHMPSPCSPQPDARSCIPAMQHMPHPSPQGKSSGAACPSPHSPERGRWPVPGQGTQARAAFSSCIDRNGRNSAALVTLVEAATFDSLVLAAGFFPYSLLSKITWTAGALRKGLSFPPD